MVNRKLNNAESFSDLVNCLVKFIDHCQTDFGDQSDIIKRFSLTYNSLVVTEFRMNRLKDLNYPKEFIDWNERYGNMSGMAGIFISSTEDVLRELEFEGHVVLKANGFLFITTDGGGNAFVYDINETPARIILMDHNVTYSLDDLEEAYNDFYDLRKDGDTWLNPRALDLTKVFTDKNEFRLDSPYVKSILMEEAAELQEQNNLLEFFKAQFIESIDYLKERHSIE